MVAATIGNDMHIATGCYNTVLNLIWWKYWNWVIEKMRNNCLREGLQK